MSILRLFTIVREKSACIVERFGKYNRTLNPGFHFVTPFVDRIAYRYSLKEQKISIEKQTAITKDNVTIQLDGALFVQITDPLKASYSIEQPFQAITLLALTVLRSEIGKMKLDGLFRERDKLNSAIHHQVSQGTRSTTAAPSSSPFPRPRAACSTAARAACSTAARAVCSAGAGQSDSDQFSLTRARPASKEWGIQCHRYEVLNIEPPEQIKISMQYEAEAERLKRKDILLSEGQKISKINIAEGQKISSIKVAEGEAESIKLISEKEAESIQMISNSFDGIHSKLIPYTLAQQYVHSLQHTIEKGNIFVAPPQKPGDKSTGMDAASVLALMMVSQSFKQKKAGPRTRADHAQQMANPEIAKFLQQQPSTATDMQLNNKMLEYYDDPALYSSDDEKVQQHQQQLHQIQLQNLHLSTQGQLKEEDKKKISPGPHSGQ